MKAPSNFIKIVNKKRYSTKTATLIAGDNFWDGHNKERGGTNTFLYRTRKGAYFFVYLTQWVGAKDTLRPCTQEEAIAAYEGQLREHEVSYELAFPGVVVADA